MKKILNYINGAPSAESNDFVPVFNPAKGDVISNVLLSDKNDFEKCIN